MEPSVKAKSLMEMMVLPIGLFFSVVYPYLFLNRRQVFNTCLKDRIRQELENKLGWNINKFVPSESNSTIQSWRILPLAVSALLFGSTLVMLFEGKMDVVFFTILLNSAYTTSLMLLPRHWFVSIGRLIASHHFWHIWSRQDYYTSTGAIKRAVLGRALSAFIVLGDDIDEIFFHVVILDLIVLQSCGLACEYSFLGLRMFFFSVFPLIVVGVKDFAKASTLFSMTSSSVIQDKIKPMFVSVLIPVITIVTQANPSVNASGQISQFEILVNILYGFVFVICLTIPRVIDGILAEDKEWKMAEDFNKVQEIWSARGITNLCSVVASVMLMEPSTIALTMILAFIARSFPEKSRIATFASHVFVLWATVGDTGNNVSLSAKKRFIVVALSTVRVALAFERRSISSVLRDIALLNAVTMTIVKDNALIPSLSFVALVSSVVAVVVAQSRLHAVRVLMRERQSHAFLSHAIKQKYCGVGGALESLLADASFLSAMSIELERLLRGALEECRQGERLCHTVNLVARIRQQTHVSSATWNNLQVVLGQWRESGVLSLASKKLYTIGKANGIVYHSSNIKAFNGDVHLSLDWDILKLCVCTWAFGSIELKIQVKEITSKEKKGDMNHQVELIMERIGGKRGIFQNNESALSTLLSAIGGRVVAENMILLSCEALWDPKQGLEESMSSLSSHDGGESIFSSMRDDDSNPRLRKYDSASTASSLPSGLVFAILDDNVLVRQNVERVCKSKLRADEQRSVFMGSKYEDCETFLQLIVDNRVDIAIIDENLEYDDNRIHVSGTWIARRARQMGFQGYLLLHSANHPIDGLDPCLDAFVEKSASRQQLVTNIVNAVQSRPRLNGQRFSNVSFANSFAKPPASS